MRRSLFFICFVILFCLAILLQYVGVFNADASWLAVCTQKLLHGGKYYTDFFETNPPMILYLSIPPVIASQFFHLNIILTYTVYIFLLIILSLMICRQFLKTIFCPQDQLFYQILMLALAFIYLFIPGYSFGQREHITLVFIMPYLLLSCARLGHVEIKKWLIIIAGLMAGIGFAIKPYFIVSLVFIEIYLMLKNKCFFYWVKTESLIILTVFIIYLISIFIITPEYIFKVLPLVWRLYPGSVATSWVDIFNQVTVCFSFIVIEFYLFRKEVIRYSWMANILIIASVGFFVAYLLQRVSWYYHAIIFVGLMVFLVFFIFSELLTSTELRGARFSNKSLAWLVFICSFIFITPVIFLNLKETLDYKINEVFLLKNIINNHGGGSIYIFPDMSTLVYPLVHYAHVQSVSRFPFFAILPQLIYKLNSNLSAVEREKVLEQKKEFIQMITEDLVKKPNLIFIENIFEQDDSGDYRIHKIPYDFNYIQFFSENPMFKQLFKQYKWVDHVMFYDVYQLISRP